MSHQLIGVCFAECKNNYQAKKLFNIAKCLGIKTVYEEVHMGDETCIMYGDDEDLIICGIDFPREAMPALEIPIDEFVNRMLNMHKEPVRHHIDISQPERDKWHKAKPFKKC